MALMVSARRALALGLAAAIGAVSIPIAGSEARGEATEIRIARQFSMSYLQFDVIDGRKLIQKHAEALGIPPPNVTFNVFSGPDAMNNALLSGSVDVVMGGILGLLTVWSKTQGTPQEVKGIAPLAQQPLMLLTRKPGIKTLDDFGPEDRIAVPAVRISAMSLYLQMAAAKRWGADKWDKLEPLTVSMSPPDSIVALESGTAGITAIFSISPYQDSVIDKPGVRVILNSHEAAGGPHSAVAAWTSTKFHDASPMLYKALMAALEEATEIVNKEPLETANYWVGNSKSKLSPEFVAKIMTKPEVKFSLVPERIMTIAQFVGSTGLIKKTPAKWQDLFFPEIHGKPGS
jgi:NitT/TauT family transport system substrate-binding protein